MPSGAAMGAALNACEPMRNTRNHSTSRNPFIIFNLIENQSLKFCSFALKLSVNATIFFFLDFLLL